MEGLPPFITQVIEGEKKKFSKEEVKQLEKDLLSLDPVTAAELESVLGLSGPDEFIFKDNEKNDAD